MFLNLWIIWFCKREHDNVLVNGSLTWLPIVQASFPVIMNIVMAVLILKDLFSGTYSGFDESFLYSPTYMAQIGIKAYPLITYFLLRDTHQMAVLLSWIIALITLSMCCALTKSRGECFSLLAYALCSGTLLYDNHHQNQATFALVTKLEDALEENERLAVEAQALELRAMIGNIAHDLKTVSMSSSLPRQDTINKNVRTCLYLIISL